MGECGRGWGDCGEIVEECGEIVGRLWGKSVGDCGKVWEIAARLWGGCEEIVWLDLPQSSPGMGSRRLWGECGRLRESV